MTDLLKNTLNVKDVIMIGGIIVTLTAQTTTFHMRISKLEADFDARISQGDKAIDLLHSIDLRLESHVAEHRGRGQ